MGKLIWHELSRYVSLTASIYAVWASFWGVFFRKFFWDFAGGILRDPGGIQPNPRISVFITLIVGIPVIQIMTIAIGLVIIALEWPFAPITRIAFHRSIPVRIILLIFQAVLAALLYQGANAALWSLVAVGFYVIALGLNERIAGSTGKVHRAGHP